MPENEKCWGCVQLVKYYPESVPMSALADVQGQDIPLCDMHWSWWIARWLHADDAPGCSAHVVNLPPALPAHNRWAPDCVHHRKPTGETTQYLTDYNREESCPACAVTQPSDP